MGREAYEALDGSNLTALQKTQMLLDRNALRHLMGNKTSIPIAQKDERM